MGSATGVSSAPTRIRPTIHQIFISFFFKRIQTFTEKAHPIVEMRHAAESERLPHARDQQY
jgi:hypothetical protein